MIVGAILFGAAFVIISYGLGAVLAGGSKSADKSRHHSDGLNIR